MLEFKRLHPRILGGMLNILSKTIKRYPDIHLERLPRMADFAKWVVAGEAGLGWKKGTFLSCYAGNQAQAIQTTLEADAIASAIIAFMETRNIWKGTPSQLLDELESLVDDRTKNSKSWPGSPAWLTRRLNRPATFLRSIGIEIEYDRSTKDRSIVIRRSGENAVTGVIGDEKPMNTALQDDGIDDGNDDRGQMPSSGKRPSEAGYDGNDSNDGIFPTQSEGRVIL